MIRDIIILLEIKKSRHIKRRLKELKTLTFLHIISRDIPDFKKMMKKECPMFNEPFNFAKQRTLKESVGFYLFYACLFMGISGIASLLGA